MTYDPRLGDRNELTRRLAELDTVQAVAVSLGTTPVRIERSLQLLGIDYSNAAAELSKDVEFHKAVREGHLRADLAERFDVSAAVVTAAATRAGMKVRSLAAALNEETLRDLYVDQGLSQQRIAERFGCDQSTVHDALKRHGIASRPRNSVRFPELHDADWLRARVAEGHTRSTIAHMLGCSPSTVNTSFRSHGIYTPRRPRNTTRGIEETS